MNDYNIWFGIAMAVLLIFLLLLNIREYMRRRQLQRNKSKIDMVVENKESWYRELADTNRAFGGMYQNIMDQSQKIIQEKGSDACPSDKISITKNKYLDLVLELVQISCDKNNILLEYDIGVDCSRLPLPETDIVSLFQNLFDNAIEACEELCEPWINLSIRGITSDGDLSDGKTYDEADTEIRAFMVILQNKKNSEHKPLENKFATTKSDKYEHGRGMGIIKDVVNRCNGSISWKDNGDVFITEIMMPYIYA